MFTDTKPLPEVLMMFTQWLKAQHESNKYLWGNSAAFDLGLLTCAYERCGMQIPWAFWNERCCRTIVVLNPKIRDMMEKPAGAHDPVIDCGYQIDYVVKTIKSLKQ